MTLEELLHARAFQDHCEWVAITFPAAKAHEPHLTEKEWAERNPWPGAKPMPGPTPATKDSPE